MPRHTTFTTARYSFRPTRCVLNVETNTTTVEQSVVAIDTRKAFEGMIDDARITEKMAEMGFEEQAGTKKTYAKMVNGKEVELRFIDDTSVRMTVRLPERSSLEPATIYSVQKIQLDEQLVGLEFAINAATEVRSRRDTAAI